MTPEQIDDMSYWDKKNVLEYLWTLVRRCQYQEMKPDYLAAIADIKKTMK